MVLLGLSFQYESLLLVCKTGLSRKTAWICIKTCCRMYVSAKTAGAAITGSQLACKMDWTQYCNNVSESGCLSISAPMYGLGNSQVQVISSAVMKKSGMTISSMASPAHASWSWTGTPFRMMRRMLVTTSCLRMMSSISSV